MIFIAEIGMNHNGNIDLCGELIKQAKLSGADIVKFQLGWRAQKGEINYIQEDDLKKMKAWADYYEIEFMCSIITEEALAFSDCVEMRRYKVASRTVVDNPNLVKQILNKGKETFLSLGMWNEDYFPFTEYKNVRYLWCRSDYPTLPWKLSLPKNFKETGYDGYSDHTIGIETCLIAISRGAEVIEKHFTLDKSDTSIRDHALSATPSEFKDLVNLGRNINRNLNLGV